MDDMSTNNGRDSRGHFLAGHKGEKKNGLPEFQRAAREKIGRFLVKRLDDLDTIYEKLTPLNQEKMLVTLTEFILPRQKEVFLDAKVDGNVYTDYTRVSQSALDEVLMHTTIENGDKI